MSIQKVTIEYPFNEIHKAVHCPVCGTILREEGGGGVCEHVLFKFEDASGEFEYILPELSGLAEQIEEELDYFDIDEFLERLESKTAMCFEFHLSGAACGPTEINDYIGINFFPDLGE